MQSCPNEIRLYNQESTLLEVSRNKLVYVIQTATKSRLAD